MTEYQIRYMVDPGDGIVSVTIHEDENDDMVGALCNWLLEQPGDGPFVVGCEIVGHSLMVED